MMDRFASALRTRERSDANAPMWVMLSVAVCAGVFFLGFASPNFPELVLGAALAALALPFIGKLNVLGFMFGLLCVRALVDGAHEGVALINIGALPSATGICLGVVSVLLISRKTYAVYGTFVAIALVLTSTYIASQNWGNAPWSEGLRFITVLLVLCAGMNLEDRLDFRRIVLLIQAVAIVPSAVALYQFATGTGMRVGPDIRSSGTIAHPNSAALLFAMALLAAVVHLFSTRPKSSLARKIPSLVSVLLFASALISTASLGGLISGGFMVIAYALFSSHLSARQRSTIIIAPAVIAVAFLSTSVGSDRLAEFDGTTGNSDNSLTWRYAAWNKVLSVWGEEPFFGQGYGATLSGRLGIENIPHNEYVRVLTEVGVVGVLLVLSMVVFAVVRLTRIDRFGYLGEMRAFNLALIGGFVVSSIAANTILYSVPTYLFALSIGFAIARSRSSNDSNNLYISSSIGSLSSAQRGSPGGVQ